jgi:5-formyltetrahydrofolate cyclo-ligase
MDGEDRKQKLRERIWDRLRDEGVDRFPGVRGRIPNFVGAEDAARRLDHLDAWRAARHLKCNPDSPQLPVRKAALRAGKTVFMAVPKLREPRPFLALDPDALDVPAHKAASIKGASRHGRPVGIPEMPSIDLVIAGAVAVTRDGARLGKGGGYSDLEFALAEEAGLITEETVVITTVHPLQIVDNGAIPMTRHDVPLDYIVTPDEVLPTERRHPRPSGILWDELPDDRIRAIPVLEELKGGRTQ